MEEIAAFSVDACFLLDQLHNPHNVFVLSPIGSGVPLLPLKTAWVSPPGHNQKSTYS
jgi:hypothetical protein